MTLEELQVEMRKNQDEDQNKFIDKIYDSIDHLCEKANHKDYIPTDHEKVVFSKIVAIVKCMESWF